MTEPCRPTDAALAAELRAAIDDGSVLRDGRLLPERGLADRFRVTRAHLRRALDLLECEGTIFRRQGQGTFVAPPPATDIGRLRQLARRVMPDDVMEVRQAVEPALAALAAARASDADVARLEQTMLATLDADTLAGYEAADDIFHYRIADTARNPLFMSVYNEIRTVRHQAAWTSHRESRYSRGIIARLGEQHRPLFAAIARRDPDAAAAAMRWHLGTVAMQLRAESAAATP